MHPIVSFISNQLREHANPQKAVEMQAYMKIEMPFYGVQAPIRKHIATTAKKTHPITSQEEFLQVISTLWNEQYREALYMALEIAARHKRFRDTASFPLFIRMTQTADHWDTLDWIAADFIGERVLADRSQERLLEEWTHSERMWLRRASLLAHLKHKGATNQELLSQTIQTLMHEKEFFIRKAIGWVLRQYSRTNPDWVRHFIQEHEDQLSGLSKREGSKHL